MAVPVPTDIVSFQQFFDLIGRAGAAGGLIFGLLYWMERREHNITRKEAKEDVNSQREEILSIVKESVAAIKDAAVAVNRIAEGGDENRQSWLAIKDIVSRMEARRTGTRG